VQGHAGRAPSNSAPHVKSEIARLRRTRVVLTLLLLPSPAERSIDLYHGLKLPKLCLGKR
jgi:hypothetical protein